MAMGPVDLSRSPFVALRSVGIDAVRLEDGFWKPRLDINRDVTIPAQLKHCYETGRIDNFRRAAGKIGGEFKGLYPFDDSDVYKWAEAASWSLATHPDAKLEADLDAVIQEIADAQGPDGYVNTYFMFERQAQRFTNLKDMHEIYCAGHLIQAAIAHKRATGKTTLLNVAIRFADLLDKTFGSHPKRLGACGHEEAEMALVELYRETGEARYLNLARFMIDVRGHKPGLFGNGRYYQDHAPFTEQIDMTGHAVRQMYLNCGAADVYAEQGNVPYRRALENLWANFVTRRMYVTGGAGSRYEGEAFGDDYELPNDRAYTETCAAIGSVMWSWRMLNITGEAMYTDRMEHTLYNGVLPGLSLDGTRYFYQNPLADGGKHRRQEWFGCACCPPNIARLLASLPGYFYSVSENGVYVHLYASGTATIPLPDGSEITLTQQANLPWEGGVTLRIESAPSTPLRLNLRVPSWSETAIISLNDAPLSEKDSGFGGATAGLYTGIERVWQPGDVVHLQLTMPTTRLRSHPLVAGNRGCHVLQRGPLIYCLEQADHRGEEADDVRMIVLSATEELIPEHRPDLLGGVTVLRGQGIQTSVDRHFGGLYFPCEPPLASRPIDITAIPYYAWANREPGAMQVWIPAE